MKARRFIAVAPVLRTKDSTALLRCGIQDDICLPGVISVASMRSRCRRHVRHAFEATALVLATYRRDVLEADI